MLEVLQNMLNQQRINNPQNTQDDLLRHQEPVAAAMRTLFKILEYEKGILPQDIFVPMVQSLQDNMNQTFEQLKIVIPPMSDIVSINGEEVK